MLSSPGYCSCIAASPPLISASWLSLLAWSTCCSGSCWDKSSASTSTCSFGWIFGVSPAAPRTRVRETRFLPWPEGPTGWACLLPSSPVVEESLDTHSTLAWWTQCAEPGSFHSPECRVYELVPGSCWEVLCCSLTALFLVSLCSLMALCIEQLLDCKEGPTGLASRSHW